MLKAHKLTPGARFPPRDATPRALTRQPPTRFHEQDVVRPRRQQRRPIALQLQIAERRIRESRLSPRNVQHRSRPVLPSEHRVAAERLLAEIRIVYCECLRGTRSVWID